VPKRKEFQVTITVNRYERRWPSWKDKRYYIAIADNEFIFIIKAKTLKCAAAIAEEQIENKNSVVVYKFDPEILCSYLNFEQGVSGQLTEM